MLRGQLSWLYNKLVKALWFVQDVLTAAEAVYGKPHRFIERTGFQFHGVLNPLRIPI